MKKLMLIAMAVLMSIGVANASIQEPVNQSKDKAVKDTVIRSVNYKIFVGPRGGRYVLRTSKNGNVYKQYLKK